MTITAAQTTPSFVGLGDLPGGFVSSGALGLSADGSTIAGFSFSDRGNDGEAIRWTQQTGLVSLGDLPGGQFLSTAFSISGNGKVVTGASSSVNSDVPGTSSPPIEAFRWTERTGMTGLGDLPGGDFFSLGIKISDSGKVIVGASSSQFGQEAFRWTQWTGIQGLGDLPGGGFNSSAASVSANGSVIVGAGESAAGAEAFRWTRKTGLVGLGDLEGGVFFSRAADVSRNGSTVVGRSVSAASSAGGQPVTDVSGTEAFLWTRHTGMLGLGDLEGGAYFSRAFAVSGDGAVVVGQSESDRGAESFVWDRFNGMQSLQDILTDDLGLDLDGWSQLQVRDISKDGSTVGGIAVNPEGNVEGWVARFRPKLVKGTRRADRLVGTHKRDRLLGLKGRDLLLGKREDDYLDGGRHGDRLFGMAGDDTLLGGHGNDVLKAGAGDDILDGGRGRNTLSGGGGRDRFILSPGEGRHLIRDFKLGQDLLQLEGISFEQLDIVRGQRSALIKDADTHKVLASLKGIDAGDLSQQDFITIVDTPVGLG